MRSPLEQVSEGQPRTTKLVVEPDAEVVQRNPGSQASPQPAQLMGSLRAKAKGIVELLVNRLDDLANACRPTTQPLGPSPFAPVLSGWAHDARSVAIEPAPMVFFALETLVGHVGSRGCRSHARQPRVRSVADGEEGLGHLLVGDGSGREAEARDDARRTCGYEQTEALVPSQAIGPSDVSLSGQPSTTPSFCVPDGHRRAVQCLVRTFLSLHHLRQMQGHLLDELRIEAHTAVELGALGQGGERFSKVACGVAIEVPFAGESGPTGEDGEGYDLAGAEGSIGTWAPQLSRTRLVEVVDHDVECGEEGVRFDHESVPFPVGSVGKPTLVCGHLPLKFSTTNSHQAFKGRRKSHMLEENKALSRRFI